VFGGGSSYSLRKDGNGKVDCPRVCSGIYIQKFFVVVCVYSSDDVYIIVDDDLRLDGLLMSSPFQTYPCSL
jgi:hypothetical protein